MVGEHDERAALRHARAPPCREKAAKPAIGKAELALHRREKCIRRGLGPSVCDDIRRPDAGPVRPAGGIEEIGMMSNEGMKDVERLRLGMGKKRFDLPQPTRENHRPQSRPHRQDEPVRQDVVDKPHEDHAEAGQRRHVRRRDRAA